MTLRTDGIVIREQTTGEKDRLITVLTRELGVVRAFVNGGRSPKNKSVSATDLLCYSDFTMDTTRSDAYVIREASPKQVFFSLREDITDLSLAQYFAELVRELAPKEEKSDEFLSLILNSMHLLCQKKKSDLLIKAVTELRMACDAGFMPSLLGCAVCSEYEKETMYFDIRSGALYCGDCERSAGAVKISPGILSAMRHISLSAPEKIYSFSLSEDNLLSLSELTEKYVKNITFKNFKTLDFYKTMKNL